MIRHQTISMADPAVARYDVCEGFKKQLAVGIIEKDSLASIAPSGHMIPRRQIAT